MQSWLSLTEFDSAVISHITQMINRKQWWGILMKTWEESTSTMAEWFWESAGRPDVVDWLSLTNYSVWSLINQWCINRVPCRGREGGILRIPPVSYPPWGSVISNSPMPSGLHLNYTPHLLFILSVWLSICFWCVGVILSSPAFSRVPRF